MRVTKPPEERKQEILEAAINVFSEKGYEKTSMSDITDSLNIAQGLVYRYFSSKEELLDCTIEQYSQSIINKMSPILSDTEKTPIQKIYETPTLLECEDEDTVYYKICHNKQTRKIYNELIMNMCEKLKPIIKEQIELANEKGEINIPDSDTAATFCVYGQQGIILQTDISSTEKIERIRSFLAFIFRK